ncbi:MAG: glycosyltransferase family 2 protein [Actinomycetota bacterium]
MMPVAALVINRNTHELLSDCLRSLQAQEYGGPITTWVVDNGSTDGSAAMVVSGFPGVQLVRNDRNVGYAAACNQGIHYSSEPVVLVMNSDTVLSPDTVRVLVEHMEANPGAAIVAPRLLNTDGSIQFSCREFPSITTAFMHAFLGLFRGDNPYSAGYKKMDWDHGGECTVDWVSGAFMALRRDAMDALGGFDEGYFMYVEDVDLCWRARQDGWTVDYLPRGDVYHHIGMSSRAVSTRMSFHHHASMLRFHRKTYRGKARRLVNPLVALGVASRFALIVALNTYYRLRSLLGGRDRHIMPGRQ